MSIWMVFVKCHWNTARVARYIDSHWADEKAAKRRMKELDETFRAFSCYSTGVSDNGLTTYLVQGELADCKITDSGTSPEPLAQ